MPAWSPAVANVFIRMAAADGKAFDQMHLQELVYIAHGWCLALTGQPLTGDRPEAFEHGPEYRRIADALANYGLDPVRTEIAPAGSPGKRPKMDAVFLDDSGFAFDEHAIMARVYATYANYPTGRLAVLTRAPRTPWAQVYAEGAGVGRDIDHDLIKVQFALINDRYRA